MNAAPNELIKNAQAGISNKRILRAYKHAPIHTINATAQRSPGKSMIKKKIARIMANIHC